MIFDSGIEKLPIHVDDDVEITTREVHKIQTVGEQEQITVTDVAARFGVTKSAPSPIITRLDRKGFLDKKQAPDNNKEMHLSLTKLGGRPSGRLWMSGLASNHSFLFLTL